MCLDIVLDMSEPKRVPFAQGALTAVMLSQLGPIEPRLSMSRKVDCFLVDEGKA